MTTQTKHSEKQSGLNRFWRKRADFRAGKTKRQRQAQFQQQITVLSVVLLATVVAGGLTIYFNWQGAGSAQTVSCDTFPQYCVPLVGGLADESDKALNESPDARKLDSESQGAPGVVRGYTPDGMPFIGDPDAPIHFAMVTDFACSHCQLYHQTDLQRFIDDYVLTGQATLYFAMLTGTGGAYSEIASQGALCAGEQGALWEMSDELFRLGNSMYYQDAFSIAQIRLSADDMGLDADELVDCVRSGRYRDELIAFRGFSNDNGITGTPTMLVSYGDSNEWAKVQRTYDTLKELTEAANAE
ncbi:MAG: thioredoxin domain-containing protein [Anaerolineae bacterium]|nr:thioredoxin domain-containing protein [Anaerolineae bacterium]